MNESPSPNLILTHPKFSRNHFYQQNSRSKTNQESYTCIEKILISFKFLRNSTLILGTFYHLSKFLFLPFAFSLRNLISVLKWFGDRKCLFFMIGRLVTRGFFFFFFGSILRSSQSGNYPQEERAKLDYTSERTQ